MAEFPSQTAALTKPYTNTGRSAPLLFTPAKMNALVTEAARRGLNVHIHAIGDLAVKASLDAFEAARNAVPQSTLPFSLAHARFVDPQDIPRFAQLKVIAVLQLLWASPEASDGVKPYIDPEIYRWMYPARSILDAGGTIAGGSDWLVVTRHIFPNSLPPLIVQTTLAIAFAILEAAALGFLGLGAQPPTPEWGAMLADSYKYFTSGAWWAFLFPGAAIMLSVLGFNLVGDGLRDALDPRLGGS